MNSPTQPRVHALQFARILGCFSALFLTASISNAQFWIRESTVLPESMTGGGSSGRGGTTTFNTSIYGGLEYNDNVTLSSSGSGGLAARFGVTSGVKYPVSANNQLSFDMSLERLLYLTGPSGKAGYDNILPGTNTTFTVFIGSVRVRNFLSAELTEDPVNSPVINNTARFGRFNGRIGTQIDWDMNSVIWQAIVSAGRQLATQSVNDQIDFWQYAAALRCVVPMGPATSVGVSTSYAITNYDLAIQNDSTTRSLGAFGLFALSKNITLEPAVGMQWTDYDDSGTIADQTDYSGVYGSLQLSHQLNRKLSYTVSLKHDMDEGYGTNFYQTTEASLAVRLKMVNKWELVGTGSYQWIDESGPTGESAERILLMLEGRRPLGRKVDGNVGIAHYEKFSDQVGKDYVQNRIYFSLRYTF